jgi:hypothetical protein
MQSVKEFQDFRIQHCYNFEKKAEQDKRIARSTFLDLLKFVAHRRNSMSYFEFSIATEEIETWNKKIRFGESLKNNCFKEYCNNNDGRK